MKSLKPLTSLRCTLLRSTNNNIERLNLPDQIEVVAIMANVMSGPNPGPSTKFLEKHGIHAQYTMPRMPQLNKVDERRNHTLMDMG